MSECADASDPCESIEEPVLLDDETMPLDEELEEEKGTSIWILIAVGILLVILIWIILGVWRYLQVASNGTF